MDEALKPLHRLEAKARESNDAAAKDYEARLEFHKLQKENVQKNARKGLANGTADAASLIIENPRNRRRAATSQMTPPMRHLASSWRTIPTGLSRFATNFFRF